MSLPTITATNVSELQSISSGHPVYRIKINNVNYSLKAETAADANASSEIKWASKIMHNAGGGKKHEEAKIRLLDHQEIDVVAQIYANFTLTGPQKIVLEDTLTLNDNVWYLMHFQPHLLNPDDNMNTGQIDQLFAIVNHGAFWKKLGKIIAVDLFTGNNDRFDFGNYTVLTPQTFWSNRGNIFLNIQKVDSVTPMGLDFYYASGAFGKDMIADQNYLRIMKSKAEIAVVSDLIVESIMDALTGKNLGEKSSKLSKFKTAVSNKRKGYATTSDKYKGYLTDSIWEGLEDVKRYLVNKRRTYVNATPPPVPNRPGVQFASRLPNNIPARPGATALLAHNNKQVASGVFPPYIEKRMQDLNWI